MLSGYRLMWMIVMFDLPVVEKAERKADKKASAEAREKDLALRKTVRAAGEMGISYLTIFSFSASKFSVYPAMYCSS
mgnify:CR=1 FL=1